MQKINKFEPRECGNTRELLDDFLAGQLLVETSREILLHLEKCERCRQEKASREAIGGRLKEAWDSQPIPDDLETKILGGLKTRSRVVPSWFRMAAGVAVTAMALAVLYLFFWIPQVAENEQQITSVDLYTQVVQDHLNCKGGPLPPGFVPPLHRVKDDIRRSLAGVGDPYRLVAIHLCEGDGVQLIHYVFQGQERFLSLMLAPKSDQYALRRHSHEAMKIIEGLNVHLVRQGPLYVASLESPGYFVYVVSEEEGAERTFQLVNRLLPSLKAALYG
ncbi:MAG: anti-sigma factor family protein [Acidobacteriota bacterium]